MTPRKRSAARAEETAGRYRETGLTSGRPGST
jgi:hypothetical protein